jgi:hypothetical protein
VNGPHYALAAKRFHPVRLSTAAHFLITAQHPPSHTSFPHTTHFRRPPNYAQSTSRHHLRRHTKTLQQHLHINQEQPLRMTIRSPIGALPRYLPNGFFPLFAACFVLLLLYYASMCCENHVSLSVNISYVSPSSNPGYTGHTMDTTGTTPQDVANRIHKGHFCSVHTRSLFTGRVPALHSTIVRGISSCAAHAVLVDSQT